MTAMATWIVAAQRYSDGILTALNVLAMAAIMNDNTTPGPERMEKG